MTVDEQGNVHVYLVRSSDGRSWPEFMTLADAIGAVAERNGWARAVLGASFIDVTVDGEPNAWLVYETEADMFADTLAYIGPISIHETRIGMLN